MSTSSRLLRRTALVSLLLSSLALLFGCRQHTRVSTTFKPIHLSAPESLEKVNNFPEAKREVSKQRILISETNMTAMPPNPSVVHEIAPSSGKEIATRPLKSPDKEFDHISRRMLVNEAGQLIPLPVARWDLGLAKNAALWLYSSDLAHQEKLLSLKPDWSFSEVVPSPDGKQVAISAAKIKYDKMPSGGQGFMRPTGGTANEEIFVVDLAKAKSTLIYKWSGKFSGTSDANAPSLSWQKTGIILGQRNRITLIRYHKGWEQRYYKLKYLVGIPILSPDGTKALIIRQKRPDAFSTAPALLTLPDGKVSPLPRPALNPLDYIGRLVWSDNNHLVALGVSNTSRRSSTIRLLTFDSLGKIQKQVFLARENLNFRDSPNISLFREAGLALVFIPDRPAPKGGTVLAISVKSNKTIWSRQVKPLMDPVGAVPSPYPHH